jgi:hypothetical protein
MESKSWNSNKIGEKVNVEAIAAQKDKRKALNSMLEGMAVLLGSLMETAASKEGY